MAGAPTQGGGNGAAQGQPAGPAGQPPQRQGGLDPLFILLPLVLLAVLILPGLTQRKERKRREEMLSGLRRNDRVQTTGGMLGRIVEVKGDEVVLKVDESNNTRIRFSKAAIQQVIKQGAGEPAQETDAG